MKKTTERKTEIDLSTPVASHVNLIEVKLLECNAKLFPCQTSAPGTYSTTYESSFEADGETNVLYIPVSLKLKALSSKDDDLAEITAKYLLIYELNNWDGLSKENFDAFAKHNGTFNVWPYWRELVQSMFARLQLPTLILPTYRIGCPLPSTNKKRTGDAKTVKKVSSKKRTTKKRTPKHS